MLGPDGGLIEDTAGATVVTTPYVSSADGAPATHAEADVHDTEENAADAPTPLGVPCAFQVVPPSDVPKALPFTVPPTASHDAAEAHETPDS